MRIGLIGPAEDEPTLLREAAEFLLNQVEVDQVVYLGAPATLRRVTEAWAQQVMQGPATFERFLDEAAKLALSADSQALDGLLARERERERLRALRGLPLPPARTVELFDDKVVLLVHDKAMLDQEDIANALLIVYGRSKQVGFHRFGPRAFFTPGPLKHGRVAVLEPETDGQLAIAQFDPRTSAPLGREIVQARRGRVVVAP